jgi:hypothetical protein
MREEYPDISEYSLSDEREKRNRDDCPGVDEDLVEMYADESADHTRDGFFKSVVRAVLNFFTPAPKSWNPERRGGKGAPAWDGGDEPPHPPYPPY